MEKVFASVRFSSPLSVAVARTSQSPFPLAESLSKTLQMKNLFYYFFILSFLVSCSNRNEDTIKNENSSTLPKTITYKSSSGNIVSEYQYDGNKLKSIISSNGTKSIISYTNNLITKNVSYDSSGTVISEFNYEYKNNKLSKTNYKIGLSETNIFYTWVNDNHVYFVDDKYMPANAINRTDFYFSNGNVIKSTNHTYYPNYYTIDKVEIVENDSKNNPFKNIEGYSLIAFDISSDFYPQTNNITKITSSREGNVNGTPLIENYFRTFELTYNSKNFPQTFKLNDSYGNSYSYDFSYF